MKILKNVLIFVFVLVLAYLLAYSFGKYFYGLNHQASFSSFIVPESIYYSIDGIFLSYIFFLTLLFTSFGGEGKEKWWWIGIGLVPVVAVELFLVPSLIYLPVILGLLGWGIGVGIHKLVGKLKVSR